MGLGGEWGGAVLLVSESAPAKRRGLFGGLVQVGNPLGRLTATGVFALATRLPESDFLSWGWRIPFLASALLIVVGLVIRLQIDETPEFQKLKLRKRTVKLPVLEALTKYRCETEDNGGCVGRHPDRIRRDVFDQTARHAAIRRPGGDYLGGAD